MNYAFARAYAKLNLSLDVVSRRDDGYHDLEMVMQSVSLFDTVAVRAEDGDEINVVSNARHIPNDERNIAVKAARAFLSAVGIKRKINITIEKRIPSSAGLAGGSADGAAALMILDRLLETNLPEKELSGIGLSVGADIPFCLVGGTALARGRGEILTPLDAMPDCRIVIAKPRRGMSTGRVFEKVDNSEIFKRPNTGALLEAIGGYDLEGTAKNVYNVFEPIVAEEIPEIYDIKKTMLDGGAMCASMTGSGSAVFGIFRGAPEAAEAAKKLSGKYDAVFSTEPRKHGVIFL